ncbi:MAG: hypothetical protein KDC45_09470 [Bacteroidetes bacterium]|nr:hypothetical protein [Bacteroidota bacterium]
MKTRILVSMMGFSLMLWFAGCSEHDSSMTIDQLAVQDELEQDADDLYNIDLIADGDGLNFSKSSSTNSPIEPLGYGRRVKEVRNQRIESRHFSVDVAEDGQSAEATITFVLRGTFVIRTADSATRTHGFFLKPFVHQIQRKASFSRNPDTTATRRWIRNWLSPAYGISRDGTLALTGDITITVAHSDESTSVYTINQDPLSSHFTVDDLPAITAGDVVTIEVPVANSNTSDKPYGIVHRGRHVQPLSRVKNICNDDGVDGDVTANDGVYTTQWTVEDNGITGYHLGIIDLFSSSTIFDDTEPYNSLVVALPYSKQ